MKLFDIMKYMIYSNPVDASMYAQASMPLCMYTCSVYTMCSVTPSLGIITVDFRLRQLIPEAE